MGTSISLSECRVIHSRPQQGAESMTRMIALLVTALVILAFADPAYAQQAEKVYRIGFLTAGGPVKYF